MYVIKCVGVSVCMPKPIIYNDTDYIYVCMNVCVSIYLSVCVSECTYMSIYMRVSVNVYV